MLGCSSNNLASSFAAAPCRLLRGGLARGGEREREGGRGSGLINFISTRSHRLQHSAAYTRDDLLYHAAVLDHMHLTESGPRLAPRLGLLPPHNLLHLALVGLRQSDWENRHV